MELGLWTKSRRKRIAEKYGLTPGEFDYFCTVPAPAPSTGRVFYPFHVLSSPQAVAMSWSGKCLSRLAHAMLCRMRRDCNKWAEKAGYGEPDMNALKFMYWWARSLCRKIQHVKNQRPTATREEITYHLLDRWGFSSSFLVFVSLVQFPMFADLVLDLSRTNIKPTIDSPAHKPCPPSHCQRCVGPPPRCPPAACPCVDKRQAACGVQSQRRSGSATGARNRTRFDVQMSIEMRAAT